MKFLGRSSLKNNSQINIYKIIFFPLESVKFFSSNAIGLLCSHSEFLTKMLIFFKGSKLAFGGENLNFSISLPKASLCTGVTTSKDFSLTVCKMSECPINCIFMILILSPNFLLSKVKETCFYYKNNRKFN